MGHETVDGTFSSVYQEKSVSMVEQNGGGQNFGEQKVRDNRDKRELDAQRQYVVIGTLALLFTFML